MEQLSAGVSGEHASGFRGDILAGVDDGVDNEDATAVAGNGGTAELGGGPGFCLGFRGCGCRNGDGGVAAATAAGGVGDVISGAGGGRGGGCGHAAERGRGVGDVLIDGYASHTDSAEEDTADNDSDDKPPIPTLFRHYHVLLIDAQDCRCGRGGIIAAVGVPRGHDTSFQK